MNVSSKIYLRDYTLLSSLINLTEKETHLKANVEGSCQASQTAFITIFLYHVLIICHYLNNPIPYKQLCVPPLPHSQHTRTGFPNCYSGPETANAQAVFNILSG